MADPLRWLLLCSFGVALAGESSVSATAAQYGVSAAYLAAYEQGRFSQAVVVAQAALASGVGDETHERAAAVWWLCLGAAAARAGDPNVAVDSVLRGQRLGGHLDVDVLALHITSLTQVNAFVQARAALDLLVQRYPYTPLAARDARLALAIDRRLAAPIDAGAVTWQIAQASAALAAARPGLALVHAEEAQLLARRGNLPWKASAATLLATVFLDLEDPAGAEAALANFSVSEADGVVGLLRLSAQLAGGHRARAEVTLMALEPGPPALRARLQEARAILDLPSEGR